jgi:hypothetical protein
VPLPVVVGGSTVTSQVTATLANASTVHMYKFTAAAGSAVVSADVVSNWGTVIRANLDLSVVVTSSSGKTLATLNPPDIAAPVGLGVGFTTVTLASAGT